MAREYKEINKESLRALAAIFCTMREAAAVLRIGMATLMRHFNDDPELRQAWDDGVEEGKVSLRRKQFLLADKSTGMAIFLGKNYLGQKDVLVQERREAPPVPPMDLSSCTPAELEVLEGIARRNEEQQAAAAKAAEAERAEQEANGETRH